jgi:hypothetical protein
MFYALIRSSTEHKLFMYLTSSIITSLNYLSSNVLSLYCIFDVQNLVLCLNRELVKIIDYKFMLKLQCKTTFNSVFVGKKNHQNRTRVD